MNICTHLWLCIASAFADPAKQFNKMIGPIYVPFSSLREKAMAPHSSTLAWKILWTEETGTLQSMGSLRVGHDWATSLSLFTFMHWRRKWQPTRVLAWRIPGTGEPGGLPSMGSHRVGHDWSDLAAALAWEFWLLHSLASPLYFLCFSFYPFWWVCKGFPGSASGKEPTCQSRRQ